MGFDRGETVNLSTIVVALLVIWCLACVLAYFFARRDHPFSLADYLLHREVYRRWYEAQVEQAVQEYEEELKRQMQR